MSRDATFEEGAERPLRLVAADGEDLSVIAALVQDAVFPASEISWQPRARRFAILLNRFRWEDVPAAQRRGRAFERVQSMLVFEDVAGVASQGVSRGDTDTVMSLLSITFEPAGGDGPEGRIVLTLAGDGAIALEVDCVDAQLRDVTRPYRAVSGNAPHHPEKD